MTRAVEARVLDAWLGDGAELALLDVREAGQFGAAHLFFAVPLPFSRLELDIARLAPRRATRMVLCDDGALGVAASAGERLEEAGYSNVHVLLDGTRGWAAAGFGLHAGVNVPSKAFGELAERHYHTPRIGAVQLAALVARGADVAIIDGRPLEEFRRMSIPGARCCPNGELAGRIRAMVPDERTTIVVNCAGRTRSIIGAQTLINLGIENPVYALENGTQGWHLVGLELEHGARGGYPEARSIAQPFHARARELAAAHGAREVQAWELAEWLGDPTRTTYVLDVRTAEEYAAATLPGAAHAPGGQLIQATDQWIAVRNARIVLVDDDALRACVTASWLRQLGHDAFVLRGGTAAEVRVPPAPAVMLPAARTVTALEAKAMVAARACRVVDVRASMAFRKACIPGSAWSIRPRLRELRLAPAARVLLVSDDDGIGRIAAAELARAGIADCVLLEGGFGAWQAALGAVVASPDEPPDDRCIDYLFFVHDRHDGNREAARAYLAWEMALLGQLGARESASFRLG